MNDSVKEINDPALTKAIDQAIHAEGQIHKFYEKSLERLVDPNGKRILKRLAEIEQNHFQILTQLRELFDSEWDEDECSRMTDMIIRPAIKNKNKFKHYCSCKRHCSCIIHTFWKI